MGTSRTFPWSSCFRLLMVWIACSFSIPAQVQSTKDRSVEVQMRNVTYHFSDSVAVSISRLHGRLVPKSDFPDFDDKNSFTLQMESSQISITPDSLANSLNSYVFAKKDAPLKGLSIRIENSSRLRIEGKLRSKGDIPFEMTGTIKAAANGRIRLHAEGIKALHVPVKGIMDLLGVDVADVIKNGKMQGVQADKDDLILDPSALFPPPHISGKVTDVQLENGRIVLLFGRADGAMPMHVPAANYMAFRGNRLRFGKLTMRDSDMVLIDMDAKDPFDFFFDHYQEQLVAGYTKETPSYGLRVFMRDYNKLGHRKR